jgi:peptidoglycan/LPS O-acetylase OafA/YrhL
MWLAAGAALLLASLLIRNHIFRETLRYSLQGLAMLPLFYAVLFVPRATVLRETLENPLLVWIGKISYSLYLWHFPVLALSKLAFPQVGLTTSVVINTIATFGIAASSYYLVELPLRHRKSPLARSNPTPLSPAT